MQIAIKAGTGPIAASEMGKQSRSESSCAQSRIEPSASRRRWRRFRRRAIEPHQHEGHEQDGEIYRELHLGRLIGVADQSMQGAAGKTGIRQQPATVPD